MAFENLFIRTKKSIGGINLDAVISESHNVSAIVTKNPTERGLNIADSTVIMPDELTIIAQVSDSPLGGAAVGQIVDTVTGFFGSATSQNLTRSAAAYEALVSLMKSGEPIEVQTKLKLYTNMSITNIYTTQDKDTSRIVSMSIRLEQIIVTDSKIVSITQEQINEESVKVQATSADNRGRQETLQPSETANRSVLKSVSDWLGG